MGDVRRGVPRTDAVLTEPRLVDAQRRLGRGVVKDAVRDAQRRVRSGDLAPSEVVNAALAGLPAPTGHGLLLATTGPNLPAGTHRWQARQHIDGDDRSWFAALPEEIVVTVEDVLQRARLLADLGRYEGADPLVARVLVEEPDNADALLLLIEGPAVRGRFTQAAAAAGQLLRTDPHNLGGLLLMARMRWALDGAREGVPFARRAVELHPDDVTCLTTLADILEGVATGSVEALTLIERAITIDPDYAFAYLVAGRIHLDALQYMEAEHWTLQALKITPADPGAVVQLGLVRAGLGRFEESREAVMAALRIDSQPARIDELIAHVEFLAIPDHFAEIYRMMLVGRRLPT